MPLRLYFKEALVKCELAVGTGKNHRDKRQDLKKRVANREAEQALKKVTRIDRHHPPSTRDPPKYRKYWTVMCI